MRLKLWRRSEQDFRAQGQVNNVHNFFPEVVIYIRRSLVGTITRYNKLKQPIWLGQQLSKRHVVVDTHLDLVLFDGVAEELREVGGKIYQAGGNKAAIHAVPLQ